METMLSYGWRYSNPTIFIMLEQIFFYFSKHTASTTLEKTSPWNFNFFLNHTHYSLSGSIYLVQSHNILPYNSKYNLLHKPFITLRESQPLLSQIKNKSEVILRGLPHLLTLHNKHCQMESNFHLVLESSTKCMLLKSTS